MTRAARRRSDCPFNASLEVFGDRWSLLIVRDLLFDRRSSYKEFLESDERIATNILADRLQRLEGKGIIVKTRDTDDARKLVYRLTTKGLDLAPVLVEMIMWGSRHERTKSPPAVVKAVKSSREKFISALRKQLSGPTAIRIRN